MDEINTATIGERFGNHHNPILRWTPGDYESLHIISAFTDRRDGEEDVRSFFDVDDFCDMAGDCSPDTVLSDSEWGEVLRSMVEA